jgi:hypothetical protein
MKTVLFAFMISCSVLGYSAEKPYFAYGDAQAMGVRPMVGAGVRAQKGAHAFDISWNVCPESPPNSLNVFHLKTLYLSFPKDTGLYFGAGLGILNEPKNVRVSGSLEASFGFQWANNLFLEANAIAPFRQSRTVDPVWPGLTLGFGF